ncbi:MAG: hypothetical protein JF616_20275 [Fibrobacteres bacterium]|jgi:hypothetical protein|nr:hypothetical protein [Fibrobacterota bacterium]
MLSLRLKRVFIPALAALGLFACEPNDSAGPAKNGSGSARVAVPALPAGYLAGASQAILFLDVAGPGMAPMHFSATMTEGKPITLALSGIPAGPGRIFHGRLVRLDSAQRDTMVTHEGSDTVAIAAGATTDVHLYLKAVGGGAVRVCLDVEGWPANQACEKPKPKTVPNVSGCYDLVVAKHGPAEDSLFKGKLRLTQKDSAVSAVLTWSANSKDTASGLVILDASQPVLSVTGQFSLKANYDSSEGLYNGSYSGPSGIYGAANAFPGSCDSVILPNQTVKFDSLECWKVSQTTVDGRSMQGTLWVGWRMASLTGWFQWDWNNAAFAVYSNTAPASGATLYLYGTLPGGFGHPAVSALEQGHYKAKLSAAGLDLGAAYAHVGMADFTGADKFADWKGAPYACPDTARTKLAGLVRPIVIY